MAKTDTFIGHVVKQINDGLKAAEEGGIEFQGVQYRLCGDIDLTYRRNDKPFNVSIRYNAHQVRIAESDGFNEKGSTFVELIDFPTAFAKTEFIRNLYPEEHLSL